MKENNIEKHFNDLSNQLLKIVFNNKKRYIAYQIIAKTMDFNNEEICDYEIKYRCFNDEYTIDLLKCFDYTIIDTNIGKEVEINDR